MFVFVYSKSAQFVAIFILFRFRISDQPNEVEEEEEFSSFFLFFVFIVPILTLNLRLIYRIDTDRILL